VRLGHPDLYKVPYEMSQLARFGYCSNVQDAETHGRREGGAVDVATLDGFCLIVRRKLLDKLGGWPYKQLPFHNYDNWLCAKAHALGYRVRMVGVYCKHLGGGHSVQTDWSDWAKQNLGKTDQQIHEESHTWLYETMRGILPISVSGSEG
jgi:GT2 family glycosyltransferase